MYLRYMNACMYVQYVYMYVCMVVYMYVCMYVQYVYIYVYIYVCMSVVHG